MNKDFFHIEPKGDNLIIIDMDNSKVDFSTSFERKLRELLPEEAFEHWDSSKYWIEESIDKKYHQTISDMVCAEGFFLNLEPMEGALQAIEEMRAENLDIIIATTPHPNSQFCINEKVAWVRKHLGEDFVKRLVFTGDKTILHGTALIDDKPEITGHNQHPSWTHIVFDAPYNRHIETPHRLTHWNNWRDVIYPLLK